MKQPKFWAQGGWASALLTPASWFYRAGAGLHRAIATPWHAPIPVICIGNVTAGGAGKTPLALEIGRRLSARGQMTHFVSRGYGGAHKGPLQVIPEIHNASQVGDETLLLANVAPTWIAANRTLSIAAAAAAGADVVVMDDGFQNPSIAKDISILVFDGRFGLGNGKILPAGPLREPLVKALKRADAAVIIGVDETGVLNAIDGYLPVFAASFATTTSPPKQDHPVFAFAGIGRPTKFFQSLEDAGYSIAGQRSFADHHPYSDADLKCLRRDAETLGAMLITTEKDLIRITPENRINISALTITIEWVDETTFDSFLDSLCNHGPGS